MRLIVERTWDDRPADVRVEVELGRDGEQLVLDVEAPFMGDPPPPGPAGPTPELWNHEVVEVFILGAGQRYLEVELSPHGHHLVLELSGVRQVVRQGMALDYRATIEADRWRARARVPLAWLPVGWDRVNAFAIHGQGAERRYLAWRPAGGEAPDFHRLEVFAPIADDLRFPSSSGSVTT